MENIKRIAENLRESRYANNPHGAVADHGILAGEYAWIMGQLEGIIQRKPAIWNILRKEAKSDTSAEKAWEATADGLDEAGLRLRAKSIERMMSGLKSLVKLAEGEEGFKQS